MCSSSATSCRASRRPALRANPCTAAAGIRSPRVGSVRPGSCRRRPQTELLDRNLPPLDRSMFAPTTDDHAHGAGCAETSSAPVPRAADAQVQAHDLRSTGSMIWQGVSPAQAGPSHAGHHLEDPGCTRWRSQLHPAVHVRSVRLRREDEPGASVPKDSSGLPRRVRQSELDRLFCAWSRGSREAYADTTNASAENRPSGSARPQRAFPPARPASTSFLFPR